MKTVHFALLATLALAASVTAQEPPTPVVPDLPPLPEFHALPSSCGLVLQVQPGDTCESIAAYANITVAKFERLNPFALCGSLDLTPGAPVCAGDTISFCNDPYVATTQDTCHKINETVGTVINVAGLNDTSCGDLTGGTRVCVSPDPSQCAVDTLCGVSLSVSLQHALASLTDYCSIAAECETGSLSLTETEGKEGLVLTISESSPALLAAVDRPGHPELAALAYHQNAATGTVLTVKITPNWFSDGSALVSSDFSVAKRRLSRRSLAGYIPRYCPPTGRTRVPSYYWRYLYSG